MCGLHREDFVRTRATDNPPLLLEVYIEILLDRTSTSSHLTNSQEEHCKNLRMSFKQLVGESIAKAWECYHFFMAGLPVARMEDWDFTQGFYYGLSQEAKEHIDNLAGGTSFSLKT
jgi:hypothetical protein